MKRKLITVFLLPSLLSAGSLDFYLDYFVKKRKEFSRKFIDLTEELDNYISGNYIGYAPVEDNYLKVTFSTRFKDGRLRFNPSVRARIDLPKTRNKFQLVLTEHDEEITHQDIGEEYGDKKQSYGSLLGLKYFINNKIFTKTSLSVGLKFKTPLDFYTRLKLLRVWDLSEKWQLIGEQKFYLFSHRGFQSFTTVNFDRKIDSVFMFRISNNAIYKKKEDLLEIGHSLMLFQHLTKRDDLIYSASVYGKTENLENKPPAVSAYEIRTVYRHILKNRWITFSVIPAVYWDRDHSFNPNLSLSFNFSILFGKYDIY